MSPISKLSFMPTKLRYKLLISFCLMSLLPILAGFYIVSLFIQFPFVVNPVNLWVVSLVTLFSLALSILGFHVTKQMTMPILEAAEVAQKIAAGEMPETKEMKAGGSDELEDLSRSLRTISKNARELLEKVEKLSLKDKLTGLYNATYIRERLSEEIQRAVHYQRPCSFAYLVINNLDAYQAKYGETGCEDFLKAIADNFNKHMREFDRAARIGRDEFVIIFPDKNKKKVIEIVESMGRELSALTAQKGPVGVGFSVGISENPIDGVSADELYIKAQDRVRAARAGKKLMEAFV